MSGGAKALIGIAMFIFMAPICIGSGVLGGCLLGMVANPTGDAGVGIGMGGGALLGLAASVGIPVLILRNMAARQPR